MATGEHVTMVSYSKAVGLALQAAEQLANSGVSVEVRTVCVVTAC